MTIKSNIQKTFEQLNELNVNDLTKEKGAFTYLSWAWAVRELLKVSSSSTWKIHKWTNNEGNCTPYMKTDTGYFVQVTVTVEGVPRTQIHPVLDNRNRPIEKPNAFHINTSIQRCLAKAIALHGLGLYIFAGEDLPKDDPLTDEEINELLSLAKNTGDENKIISIKNMIDSGQIGRTNYIASKAKLKRLSKEKK